MEAGGAIGIDIGSAKSVMAAVRQRGIDIILSDSSNKSTPTVVAYTEEERLIGDAAMNQYKKNFKNTLQFFPRLLGLNTDCIDQLKEEEKYITYKLVPLENKKIGIEINSRGQQHVLTPEQVLAYYLKRTKKNFEQANILTKDIVVSVPSYFSNVERQAILDACEIAHYKCLRVINESTAVCLNYGFFRKSELPEKGDPRNVVFVDLGHSKLTVTIAGFHQNKNKIYCHVSDRNLGARNMDYQLVEKLGEEFTKKYGCDPRKNMRARLRMLDTIEKQRKILSANLEATIHLESLLEDEDMHRNMKRTEFEEMIKPIVNKFGEILQDALNKSGLKHSNIHSVEMVGEATRIPLIQEKTKEIFKIDQVSRTLNSLECIARGCSLQSAMLSPLFKVADYEVFEYNLYPVCMSYQFFPPPGEQGKVVTKEIFSVGSTYPTIKSITFDNKKGGMDLLLHYGNETQLLHGLPTQIAQYKIKEANPKHEKYSFVFKISNNIHQICCLEGAEIIEEWVEDEKIPVKKDVPASKKPEQTPPKGQEGQANASASDQQPPSQSEAQQQQQDQNKEAQKEEEKAPEIEYEIKKRNKKTTSSINFETQAHALPPNVRKQFREFENKMFDEDNLILELKAAKNDLESYIYDLRANIKEYGNYEKYIDPSLKEKVFKEVQVTEEWLYSHENAPGEEYKKRLDEFKKIGEPIKKRYHFYAEIYVLLEQVDVFNSDLNQRIQQVLHMTEEQRGEIFDKFNEMSSYVGAIKAEISSKKSYEDVSYNIYDVHIKCDEYKATVNKLLTAPPPTQAATGNTPKRKEEEASDTKEVEMKDESKDKK